MYKNKKVLAVICARGGSKGIPGKNWKLLAGKPLIAHSILAAKNCSEIDEVLVSTDHEKIRDIALEYGAVAPFIRPTHLANDTVGRIAAVIHAVQEVEKTDQSFDIVLDLSPMSPLRTSEDILGTLKTLVENKGTDVVFTVTPAGRNPYYNMVEQTKNGLVTLSKKATVLPSSRQQAPQVFDMNDSVYAFWKKVLLENKDMTLPIQLATQLQKRMYEMPEERSVDIDRLLDFTLVELLMTGKV